MICEDLSCGPEFVFVADGGALTGATVPGGGGGNGPFCCAARVTVSNALAIKRNNVTPACLPSFPLVPAVSPRISFNLLRLIPYLLYLRIRCIGSEFRGLSINCEHEGFVPGSCRCEFAFLSKDQAKRLRSRKTPARPTSFSYFFLGGPPPVIPVVSCNQARRRQTS